jgi:hypothetical protein
MAKNYGSMVDVIPAKGGMGPGGVDKMPAARMGRGTTSSREELDRINKEYKEYMAGLGKKGYNPPETKTAAPLTKDQMRARDRANAEVQKKLPVRRSNPLVEDVEEELVFKKGGSVSSASKRADGCAVRGKTRA